MKTHTVSAPIRCAKSFGPWDHVAATMSTSPVTVKQEDLEGFPVLNSAVKQEYDESTVKFMLPLAAARNCLGTMSPCLKSIKQETTHTSPLLHSAVKQEDVCVPQTEAFGETAVEDAGTSHRCNRVNDHELEQISRTIVMFARYPHKRPQQLIVEDDGSMLLSNLMDAWGDERQYSQTIIIDAVFRHMYHEDTEEDLRFDILETEGSESLRIKVMPSRGKTKHVCKARPHPLMLTDERIGSDPFIQRRHKRARLDCGGCSRHNGGSREQHFDRGHRSRYNVGRRFCSREQDLDMVKYGLMMYRMGQRAQRADSRTHRYGSAQRYSPSRRNRFSRCTLSPRRGYR